MLACFSDKNISTSAPNSKSLKTNSSVRWFRWFLQCIVERMRTSSDLDIHVGTSTVHNLTLANCLDFKKKLFTYISIVLLKSV